MQCSVRPLWVSDGASTAQGTVTLHVVAGPGGPTLNLIATASVDSGRRFTAVGIPGRVYVLQRAAAVSGPWTDVPGPAASVMASASGEILVRDTAPPTGPTTFYRVVETTAP